MQTYAVLVPINHNWTVSFPEHLAQLRKERGFTQPQLAEKIGLHVAQIRRYEAGTSQPTLDVIRGLAVALGVSADELLFAKNERGPDDTLKLQFEAVSRFTTEEKHVVKSLLEGMILQHEARRWAER
jgi:transcriptional regulator with XRE-family HTH domain